MNEDLKELGDEDVTAPFWPPDQAMRLECLRMAVNEPRFGNVGVLARARAFYDFVQGMVELPASKPQSN